jgi:Mn-dependent DtxR family transcriptional regulator
MARVEPKAKARQDLRGLLLQEMPTRVLLLLKKSKVPSYASQVSKEVDCTYSHTVNLLEEMSRLGLIKFERKGKIKYIHLTTRGAEFAVRVEQLVKSFGK